jgi:DNA-binding Lrp family transcriptional regulator
LLLTKFQKQLCNILQDSLPLSSDPFDKIAASLNAPTETVLNEIKSLQNSGLIRRIAPLINYRALGFTATLVTAHIPESKIPHVADAVNSINNVSHNYLRDHHYNLWFTLIAPSKTKIDKTLENLSADCDCDFHSLPALRTFKLNVRFDADSNGRCLMQNNAKIPQTNPVNLSENEKRVLSKLQTGLKTVPRPFEPLAANGLTEQNALKIIRQLINKGVIRRLAATVDYRSLGFTANALFVAEVPEEKILDAGRSLAALPLVSHCYQRATFENWPYNLFAMLHSRSLDQIKDAASRFLHPIPEHHRLRPAPLGKRTKENPRQIRLLISFYRPSPKKHTKSFIDSNEISSPPRNR